MKLSSKKILSLFRRHPRRPLRSREIADHLRLAGKERKLLKTYLTQMVRNSELTLKRGAYLPTGSKEVIEGIITLHRQGYGFLQPQDSRQEALFIPARYMGNAMDGDRVQVSRSFSPRDGRASGRIEKILQRAHETVVGCVEISHDTPVVQPLDPRHGGPVRVPISPDREMKPGQVVLARIRHYATRSTPASGEIVKLLGHRGDPRVDILATIHAKGLPDEFTENTLTAAVRVAVEPTADDLEGRGDLRYLPLMTIDDETAQDFDDAVAVRPEGNGQVRLWVCIADVAHYVEAGSLLDRAARERGTSVYFPGFCLPMLPESLSNNMCSLVPGRERLALTVELLFNRTGEVLDRKFYQAVIVSRRRLTYGAVAALLAGKQGAADGVEREILRQIPVMHLLSKALTEKRIRRGGLDLDVPEAEVRLDADGAPVEVVRAERNEAHRIIENFMLAANEAVAAYLTEQNVPILYRVHEPPDREKIHEFQQLAAEFGHGLVCGGNLAHGLQTLLGEIAGTPESRLLNQQLLRSLKQAYYSPENRGHFGLAADYYCHFTSPIRRYPDLLVHRALKQLLFGRGPGANASTLSVAGDMTSMQERRAMEAERDIVELRRCQLIRKRLGEEFAGRISSVVEFGFFVEIEEPYVEGLVHIKSLEDDYYHFDPHRHCWTGTRRRRLFRCGDPVRVQVASVDLNRRYIDFVLVGTPVESIKC